MTRQPTQRATKGKHGQISAAFRYLIRRSPPKSLRYRLQYGLPIDHLLFIRVFLPALGQDRYVTRTTAMVLSFKKHLYSPLRGSQAVLAPIKPPKETQGCGVQGCVQSQPYVRVESGPYV